MYLDRNHFPVLSGLLPYACDSLLQKGNKSSICVAYNKQSMVTFPLASLLKKKLPQINKMRR